MARIRLGIIDLGTNSVRFDVHEVRDGKVYKTLYRERLMVRLGQGVFLNGELNKDAIARTVEAFVSFRYTADFLNVQKIVAVATSAVRQSSNRERLVNLIKKRTGINLRVISGQEEARLIARGILDKERELPKEFAMVDIGGGSTEISFGENRKIVWSRSLPLGSSRLEQLFSLSSADLTTRERVHRIKELRAHIKKIMEQALPTKSTLNIKKIIGSSGTIKALAKIEGEGDPNHDSVSAPFLRRLVKQMGGMSNGELLTIPGMDPSRTDMIVVSAVLLSEILDSLGIDAVQLTDYALRDGILAEELKLLREKRDSHLSLHLVDLEDRLNQSLLSAGHARKVAEVLDELFVKLGPLHKLRTQWKNYLLAAAYLQNTGTAINALHHEEHSFYIAQHLDFPWLEDRERTYIAHLCLWHDDGKVSSKALSFIKSPTDRISFQKAAALLRLANALVWHNRSSIHVLKAKISRSSVHLRVSANGSRQLVQLRVEARKKLFEKVFKKVLVLETE